jgi:hypothetical protein
LEGDWKEVGRRLEGGWKEIGKRLEGGWKEIGRRLERGWKEIGKRLEGDWKEVGRRLERLEKLEVRERGSPRFLRKNHKREEKTLFRGKRRKRKREESATHFKISYPLHPHSPRLLGGSKGSHEPKEEVSTPSPSSTPGASPSLLITLLYFVLSPFCM